VVAATLEGTKKILADDTKTLEQRARLFIQFYKYQLELQHTEDDAKQTQTA
jgi:hypothetical protein